jgi:hypothetical protein
MTDPRTATEPTAFPKRWWNCGNCGRKLGLFVSPVGSFDEIKCSCNFLNERRVTTNEDGAIEVQIRGWWEDDRRRKTA